MMKKSLALTLAALSTYGALTSGCVIPMDMPDSVSLTAEIRDFANNPLDVYFDYYMDVHFFDGTVLSYVNRDAASDYYGMWNYQSSDLAFYTQGGGVKCYNTCVGYDSYGCYDYATDCYNDRYTYSLDVSDISYAQATIGVDTGLSYVTIPSSLTRESHAITSTTYKQSDLFKTPFIALRSKEASGVKTQSLAGKNASVAIATEAKLASVKTHDGQLIDGMKIRERKPRVITDLSTLNAEQMSRVIAARKTLKLPAASFAK
jgi:hypothetical protein